ncbi:MAG: hypothetical protein EOP18_08715, partial [Rhizobiaceae bacterium]
MRRTGGTLKTLGPQDAAERVEVDGAVLEETIRRLGEAVGVSVWTWDANKDIIHHMGGSRRKGRASIPLDGMLQSVDPADRTRVKRRLRAAARSGGSGTIRLRSTPASGSRVLSGTFFPLDDGVPTARLQIIIQDVTQAVETEQALRESVKHYRTAVDLN